VEAAAAPAAATRCRCCPVRTTGAGGPGQFAADLKGRALTGRVEDGRLVPYYERADIVEHGALHGKRLEMLWLADPVDAFFLQIQGSGRVRLPNGKVCG